MENSHPSRTKPSQKTNTKLIRDVPFDIQWRHGFFEGKQKVPYLNFEDRNLYAYVATPAPNNKFDMVI